MTWTADVPAPGLVVHQPARGFRYGAEAFWVVGFALEGGTPCTALDLGTGSGILAWLLARHGVDVLGVDVRPEWRTAWSRTASASVAPGRVQLEVADVMALPRSTVDLVVSNPPFFAAGSGPEPVDPWRRAARFEGSATVADFARVACRALVAGGRAVLVVPRERVGDVLGGAPTGFCARRMAHVGRRRSLVELSAGAGVPDEQHVDEGGARVAAWYASAAGALAPSPRGA